MTDWPKPLSSLCLCRLTVHTPSTYQLACNLREPGTTVRSRYIPWITPWIYYECCTTVFIIPYNYIVCHTTSPLRYSSNDSRVPMRRGCRWYIVYTVDHINFRCYKHTVGYNRCTPRSLSLSALQLAWLACVRGGNVLSVASLLRYALTAMFRALTFLRDGRGETFLLLALIVDLISTACVEDSNAGVNRVCKDMLPVCTSAVLTFPAGVNAGKAESGNQYQCLRTQPNPAWYYLQVDNSGKIEMALKSDSDIDFALWGPYSSIQAATSACGALPNPIDCSYSGAAFETPEIPASAVNGEVRGYLGGLSALVHALVYVRRHMSTHTL